jgi:hypothetical protein
MDQEGIRLASLVATLWAQLQAQAEEILELKRKLEGTPLQDGLESASAKVVDYKGSLGQPGNQVDSGPFGRSGRE